MPLFDQVFTDPLAPGMPIRRLPVVQPIEMIVEDETTVRLQRHRAVLESFGVADLSALGDMTISEAVVPQPGLTTPTLGDIVGPATMFQSAYRRSLDGSERLEPIGGSARLLNAVPFPVAGISELSAPPAVALSGVVEVDAAYWAAREIILADDTLVVLKYPNRYLTIICEKLTVGRNVTFTWERPIPPGRPQKPPQLDKNPEQMPTPEGLWGVTGDPGADGTPGGKGPDGAAGPELEIWTLEMTGSPSFDLGGQNGFPGGEGGNGQHGRDGSKGRDAQGDWVGWPVAVFICRSGPGNGGDGGPGGKAGDGGPGGNGGNGGRFSFYAPRQVLDTYIAGFFINVDGGDIGDGGIPGVPGGGGWGGQIGNNPQNCSMSSPRVAGNPGAQGAPGSQGRRGNPGDHYPDAIKLKAINPAEFTRKLLQPAIIRFSSDFARVSDSVTVYGLRLTPTDTLVIMPTDTVLTDEVACQTTFVTTTELRAVVPAAMGGRRRVQVRQTDGTLSNPATLYVLPTLTAAEPGGPDPPIFDGNSDDGTGFAPNALVRVNGQDMAGVRCINGTHLQFTLVRPAAIQPNPAGEQVSVVVVLADGTGSNSLPLVLDTYRILVLGDSIQWGQGLREHEKIGALVARKVQQIEGNIGVYQANLAHSGAPIGISDDDVEDSTVLSGVNQEVPTSYPTILQQCDGFAEDPDTIDLILMDGGINDVNVRRVLNPFTSSETLTQLVLTHCYRHMSTLLERVTNKFPKAKVMVTGYYQILSEDSNLDFFGPFLTAFGVMTAGLLGGVAGAVLGDQEKKQIISNCRTFAEESRVRLQAAVDEGNAALGDAARVSFVDPGFAKENAALAADSLLYAINADLSPQDGFTAGGRGSACVSVGEPRTDVEQCKRASVGHPNSRGAQAYADAIADVLLNHPVTEFAGFADLHCHPAAHLAFGGNFLFGEPEGPMDKAVGWCTRSHGPGGTGLPIVSQAGNLFMTFVEGGPGHLVGGYPQFDGWPRFSTIAHQHMYIDWIRRAYKGGLRLMCALAVNNQLLAKEFGGASPYDDVTAINTQIPAIKRLCAAHADWMKIAYSPADARRILGENKLAVVLGVEVDALGNWKRESDCTNADVAAELRRLYDMGVRFLIPIHLANNAFGGCDIRGDMFGVLNRFLNDDYLQVADGSASGIEFRLEEEFDPVVAWYKASGWYAPPDYKQIPGAHVNVLGLTDRGRFLIAESMRRGIMLDIDHMSQRASDETLDIVERYDYPVVSGHTSFRELAWRRGETEDPHKLPFEGNKTAQTIERIRRLGGVIAPITNQGDTRSWGNRIANDCPGSSRSWAQAYLYAVEKMGGRGVALGTDFNGGMPQPSPRFGPAAAHGVKKRDLSDDGPRAGNRRAQVDAQTNGVRYARPTQYYRTERWEPGDAYGAEERDIWEAIILGRSSADIDRADIRGNRGLVEVPARSPGSVIWIKNIAKGIRAGSDTELPQPSDSDRLLNFNAARVQRGAYYAKFDGIPTPYEGDPEIKEVFDKVRTIWVRCQAMEGNNNPLPRSTAAYRDFDINIDGLAHYGMLPDFIQDLRNIGLGDDDLAPLLRSAADFIETWEKCERRTSAVPPADAQSQLQPFATYALRAANGRYLTAMGGGGRTTDVVHTDAKQIAEWERFTLVPQGGDKYALRTASGQYLTAVGGGGRRTDVIHTEATAVREWEKFTRIPLGGDQYAFRTPNGMNYFTAEDGGGRNFDAISTDRTAIGAWENFTLEKVGNQHVLKTANERYLTAMGGGGRTVDVIHTDATQVGPWELFTLEDFGDQCALKTANGNYVSAMGGGGRNSDVMHTVATRMEEWEKFRLISQGGNQYALQTANGNYVTAEDGGGRTADAISTDRTAIGSWEKFTLEILPG